MGNDTKDTAPRMNCVCVLLSCNKSVKSDTYDPDDLIAESFDLSSTNLSCYAVDIISSAKRRFVPALVQMSATQRVADHDERVRVQVQQHHGLGHGHHGAQAYLPAAALEWPVVTGHLETLVHVSSTPDPGRASRARMMVTMVARVRDPSPKTADDRSGGTGYDVGSKRWQNDQPRQPPDGPTPCCCCETWDVSEHHRTQRRGRTGGRSTAYCCMNGLSVVSQCWVQDGATVGAMDVVMEGTGDTTGHKVWMTSRYWNGSNWIDMIYRISMIFICNPIMLTKMGCACISVLNRLEKRIQNRPGGCTESV